MKRMPVRNWLVGLQLAVLFSIGCTYDIGYREAYRQIVGQDVLLPKAMVLWLPVPNNVQYSSFPYEIVGPNIRPFSFLPTEGYVQQGTIITALPLGTRLHVEKVKHLYAFDDEHDDALGTVYVPSLGRTFSFSYNFHNGRLLTTAQKTISR